MRIRPVSFGSVYKIKGSLDEDNLNKDHPSFSNSPSKFSWDFYIAMRMYRKYQDCPYTTVRTTPKNTNRFETVTPGIYTYIISRPKFEEDIKRKIIYEAHNIPGDPLQLSLEEYPSIIDIPENQIRERVRKAPKGYQVAYLDSEKFEEFNKKKISIGNIGACLSNYLKEEGQKPFPINSILHAINRNEALVMVNLETFPASEFELRKIKNSPNYRANFMGIEDKESNFPKSITQLSYFALKELGVKKVPVYVDETTYETGKNAGILI